MISDKVETELEPCPKCGSSVEFMTSRDLDILQSYISCNDEQCDLVVFLCESMSFIGGQDSYESVIFKNYNAWAKTKPERYHDEQWAHYTKR